MMVKGSKYFVVCLVSLLAGLAWAGSFESQQKNTAIIEGFSGEPGIFLLDATQTLYLWQSPEHMNAKRDQGFAYRTLNGDFIFTTQLHLQGKGEGRITYGLQVSSTGADALTLQTRMDSMGNMQLDTQGVPGVAALAKVHSPDVMQIERKDGELIFSAAAFGHPLQVYARVQLPHMVPLAVGVYRDFIANQNATLELHNLRWVIPAWKNFVPYHDYLGSRLEILDVTNGDRKVIYETAAGIEAPNWTSDGEYIIYDFSGRIYKLHLPSKKIAPVNTGFQAKGHNDHVVSYKGKVLGITHLDDGGDENWSIYKMPMNGGEPQQLTFKPPSYLHNWSPDGRYILYTSQRNGEFKLYRGASDGSGEELQLTSGKSMDDGPEYSPDGKYIYFNSTRSGKMHIWRMDADGKNLVQLTSDNFNDWFPHISPDGKQLLFMSYQGDVKPELHPYYQQVYLRAIPVGGGDPKVVAYVYGGQGTINSPSWSPDGRYVAFVSNSQLGADKP